LEFFLEFLNSYSKEEKDTLEKAKMGSLSRVFDLDRLNLYHHLFFLYTVWIQGKYGLLWIKIP
jgi:hypothetical protein